MNFVAELTWLEVEQRISAGAAAILPIGAAAKEHGLHLPMNSDQTQAEWFAARLSEEINALVWPTIVYGPYPAFSGFPGSISLSAGTFVRLLEETLREILRWHPRHLYVLNTGISTIEPADEAIGLVRPDSATHLPLYKGRAYTCLAQVLALQSFGSHADELETSIMLHIAPDKVDMAHAIATPHGPFNGPLTRDNSPAGTYGDPRLATSEKGKALTEALMADLVGACMVSNNAE